MIFIKYASFQKWGIADAIHDEMKYFLSFNMLTLSLESNGFH